VPAPEPAGPTTSDPAHPAPRPRLVLALGSLCAFITSLNQSIMSVAFADLRRSFPDVPASQLSWILNVYTIVAGATLILSAVLATRYGRKRVLLSGLALFAAAGLACAAAPGPLVLIAARAVQALGWACITPAAVALIIAETPEHRRASAIATWGGAGGVATALAPSLGAVLIEAGTWRMAFLSSVPFALIVLVVGARLLHESRPEDLVRQGLPDLVGVACILGGMVLFILGLVQSASWGWADARTAACLAAGVALLSLLLWRSTKVPRPVIDPRLLRYRNLRHAMLMLLGFGTGFFATNLGLVLFLTQVWHFSIVRAGTLVTPIALMVVLLSPVAGRVADRHGHRALVVPAGLFWLAGAAMLLGRVDARPDVAGTWLPAMVLLGAGAGLGWPAIHGIPVIGVATSDVAAATAMNQTVSRAVGALGVALAVTLVSTDAAGAAALTPFRRLFVLMAVSGVLLSVVGTRIRTAPAHTAAARLVAPAGRTGRDAG
jgi:MFS family permease